MSDFFACSPQALPCVSDADPGGYDDDSEDSNLLMAIREAQAYLRCAEYELLRGESCRQLAVETYINDALIELGAKPL